MYVATAPSSVRRWRSWARPRTAAERGRTEIGARGRCRRRSAHRAGPAPDRRPDAARLARLDRSRALLGVDRTGHRGPDDASDQHEPGAGAAVSLRHARATRTTGPAWPVGIEAHPVDRRAGTHPSPAGSEDRVAVDWTTDELATLAAIADTFVPGPMPHTAARPDRRGAGDRRRSRPGPAQLRLVLAGDANAPPANLVLGAGATAFAGDGPERARAVPAGLGASRASPSDGRRSRPCASC